MFLKYNLVPIDNMNSIEKPMRNTDNSVKDWV